MRAVSAVLHQQEKGGEAQGTVGPAAHVGQGRATLRSTLAIVYFDMVYPGWLQPETLRKEVQYNNKIKDHKDRYVPVPIWMLRKLLVQI